MVGPLACAREPSLLPRANRAQVRERGIDRDRIPAALDEMLRECTTGLWPKPVSLLVRDQRHVDAAALAAVVRPRLEVADRLLVVLDDVRLDARRAPAEVLLRHLAAGERDPTPPLDERGVTEPTGKQVEVGLSRRPDVRPAAGDHRP